MKILLIGKGGREHAIAWKLAQSPKLTGLYAAPGSPGIARYAECIPLPESDFDGLIALAERERIDLTFVGPEVPLAAGIADRFHAKGLTVCGPTQAAARIEADKDFALELMHKHGVPTGKYRTFTDADAAWLCIRDWGAPVVLKASGLAAGKGAIVCHTLAEARAAVESILVRRVFGDAGNKLVVMEYLEGEEASIFGFTDGEHIVFAVSSQDHKPIGEGDTGPNTGGMGAYAPAPVITPARMEDITDRVMRRTIRALAAEGRPYTGILYGGIIITKDGPKVIEFNCRLGDPEAQVVLPLLKTDLVNIFSAICDGTVQNLSIETDPRAATCVVMASGGYPGAYKTGYPIAGIEDAEAMEDVIVFHAGTAEKNGRLFTDGGRVLAVTALGDGIPAAIEKAYEAVGKIRFQDAYCRKDIGRRALAHLTPGRS